MTTYSGYKALSMIVEEQAKWLAKCMYVCMYVCTCVYRVYRGVSWSDSSGGRASDGRSMDRWFEPHLW